MQLNLNSTEGKLLVIVVTCLAIYWIVKALAKHSEAKKQQEKTKVQELNPVWTRDTKKKWTTSGWYYNEEKGKWISPDYANAKANTSMPEFRSPEIIERHQQWRKEEGKGPTYEEWKAARMKEQGKTDN